MNKSKKEKRDTRILECMRCGHSWVTYREKNPKVCARCKSPYWDKPYVRKDFIKGTVEYDRRVKREIQRAAESMTI